MADRDVPTGAAPPPAAPPRHPARRSASWAGWALTAAAAAPTVLAVEAARRVLDGSLDTVFGLVDPSTGLLAAVQGVVRPTTAQLLTERWSLLWQVQPPHLPLLAGALGTVVLAALVVAGRPAALVPRAVARWAAAAIAAGTALAALAALAGFAAQAAELLPRGAWQVGTPFTAHAGTVGVLVLTAALAAASAFALLRGPGAGAERGDDGDPAADGGQDAPPGAARGDAEDSPADRAGPAPGREPVGPRAGAPAAPAPDAATSGGRGLDGVPRVPQDELALYRRPR
ncbi:hypothetical protein [Kineococcus sp. G2]|uniref:hypothetical protein n=1 Tax=Kineococcus sp. G2 TaxID=3127484 RepID=UPI00301CF665